MSRAHDYERLPRTSLEAQDLCTDKVDHPPASSWLGSLGTRLPGLKTLASRSVYTHYVTPRHKKRSIIRLIYWTIFSFPYVCLLLVIIASTFFPSYTHRPKHYDALRQRALTSELPGRANPHNEKIFIAASLYESHGELTSGAWGRSVLQLVDLLGPDNVHLSVYEDNASADAKRAMTEFQAKAACMSCRPLVYTRHQLIHYQATHPLWPTISTSAPCLVPRFPPASHASNASPSLPKSATAPWLL